MRFILFLYLTASLHAFSQSSKSIYIGFYNQENLFDTIDNPLKQDEEWLPTSNRSWNTERYTNKINHMADVISSMNDGKGPDILGMCEVENNTVLNDLLHSLKSKGLDCAYIWFDSPDERGIDNAILYKRSLFNGVNGKAISINPSGLGGDHTRDIIIGGFELAANHSKLFVFANHFPSRREGQQESEYKRVYVANALRNACDSIQKRYKSANIICLGDFNDLPDNKSLHETLNAKEEGKANPKVDYCNLSYNLWKSGAGSYLYKGSWDMIDQIIINPTLQQGKSGLSYRLSSVNVYKKEWMIEQEGKYNGSPLRTFGGQKYLNGYSDHFPVYAIFDVK